MFSSIFFILSISFLAQDIKVTSGSIKLYKDYKSQFVDSRTIAVWLPDGYNETESYSVLYMHDGQNLFDANTTWHGLAMEVDAVLGKLITDNKVQKTIVVGIYNNGDYRHSEYFPEKIIKNIPDGSRKIVVENQLKSKPQADNYLRFLVEELKPFIDKNFYTKTDLSNTIVGGVSMGGLISLYAMCEYPQVFGGAICMSTHLPMVKDQQLAMVADLDVASKFRNYLLENLPSPDNHKIYMDYGDQTLDAYYKTFQQKIDMVLNEKRYNDKSWTTKFFAGEGHSEASWTKRLDIPLVFMLPK